MENINLKDFDVEVITSNVPVVLETNNYMTIEHLCKESHFYKNMSVIIGEPGYGKTISLAKFKQQNKDVYYITVKKSMSPKIFYSTILDLIGCKNHFKESNIFTIVESIAYYLNKAGSNNLLIIDEAGKLSNRSILYLHDLRDSCKDSTGIVMAGPKYFEHNIRDMLSKNVEGIPEFFRRVNNWIELEMPSTDEKMALCKHRGISSESLSRKISTNELYKTLSDIDNLLMNYGLLIRRQLNE